MRYYSINLLFLISLLIGGCNTGDSHGNRSIAILYPETITLSSDVLADKIKGAWAGQVIGCTYGGPTEFRFCGTMIQDYTPIPWDENRMIWYYENEPGLYDDIYMDLTFVDVFDREGLEAPATSHARAFAHAGYKLWHANQSARYNILNGLQPPASGHWENNPHADDIDFQIEADFAGIMSPGLVNTAGEICDKIGHIMNYGDGWYGGVFVAAMYSLAFIHDDIEIIVEESLKKIPEESDFYQCISDVISWYRKYPDDWKNTWFACQKKWSSDVGCPDGVFTAFNIDAKINAAYIVIGLLYGRGDFGQSIDISTRCGQDSDCNPASAAGVLGTVLGYSRIPDYWKQGLGRVEDIDFKYTNISLNDAYEMSYNQAMANLEKNGATRVENSMLIQPQKPVPVRFEKGFANHKPKEFISISEERRKLNKENRKVSIEFEGNGFVVTGRSALYSGMSEDHSNDAEIEVRLDGAILEQVKLPSDFTRRRNEITWKYNLPNRKHHLEIKLLKPEEPNEIILEKMLIYTDKH